MEALRQVTSTAVPLERSDVDTDQIIPSDWLKRVERTGFGQGLFSEWREDSSFVLNDSRYLDARILVTGPNFGTGSSREHAVWALMDYGFSVVISPRFGDIFRNNCTKNGLLPVVLSPESVTAIMEAVKADPTVEISVDVESLKVVCEAAGIDESFPLEEFTQHRFLEGLDEVGITLQHEDEISDYEKRRPSFMPVTIASN